MLCTVLTRFVRALMSDLLSSLLQYVVARRDSARGAPGTPRIPSSARREVLVTVEGEGGATPADRPDAERRRVKALPPRGGRSPFTYSASLTPNAARTAALDSGSAIGNSRKSFNSLRFTQHWRRSIAGCGASGGAGRRAR
jgi:hypothetical protein